MSLINHICPKCMSWMLDHLTALGFKKCVGCGFCKPKDLKIMGEIDNTIDHIKLEELNPHKYQTTLIIDMNLKILLERMNKIRNAYGKPMIITSGLRSEAQQNQLIADGKSTASKSKHLIGAACDVSDPNKELANWIKDNMVLMEEIGLWFEDFNHTKDWVHCQTIPPTSGKRVFIP